jgi:hypothetical protein
MASAAPDGGGFDLARIEDEGGGQRSLSRPQYEKLPLADRIRLVLQDRVRFFRNGQPVPANEALKVSGRR